MGLRGSEGSTPLGPAEPRFGPRHPETRVTCGGTCSNSMHTLLPLVVAATLFAAPAGPASPATSAAPAAAGENQCLKCHGALATQTLRRPVEAGVHANAKLACSACHGGNPDAKSAVEAHSGTFVDRPRDAAAVVAMCGRCHAKPAENYKRSPHFTTENAPRRATCVTCHGSHEVASASLDLIGEPLCTSCHGLAKPRRIWKALTDAETNFDSVDALMAKETDGKELRAKLLAARSDLRGLSHAHNLFDITRKAAEAVALAEEARAKVTPRVQGLEWGKWGRVAGAVAAFVLVLAAVGWAALWVRRRHRQAPPLVKKRLRWLAVGLLALGLPFALAGWKVNSYIEHDPKFCTSCHIMSSAYQAWDSSGHKSVECHACHKADVGSNLHQLWMYTTERPENVIKHAFVDRKACERCHSSGSASMKWGKVAETAGHKQHVGKEHIECVQCHGLTVHRFKPGPELCKGCHTQVSLATAGSMAEMHCLECHPFLAKDGSRSLKPDRAACLECHGDMKVKNESFPAEAPMSWACGECHKPHKQIRIGQTDCLGCHEDKLGKGIHAVKSHAVCLTCHVPHAWKVTDRPTCLKCHPDRQNHNPDGVCADCHGAE